MISTTLIAFLPRYLGFYDNDTSRRIETSRVSARRTAATTPVQTVTVQRTTTHADGISPPRAIGLLSASADACSALCHAADAVIYLHTNLEDVRYAVATTLPNDPPCFLLS